MIVFGVTGGIGSGKSTVCSLFEKKGIHLFPADAVAREISERVALKEILSAFGETILTEQRTIDRKKLADLVFSDPSRLELLQSIIHPKVFDRFTQWKKDRRNDRYVLVESALLFESGMFRMVDYVLAVLADELVRINRVMERDHVTADSVRARMNNQISVEELLELSDFQITNNGTIGSLQPRIDFFHLLFSTLTPPVDEP